MEPSFSTVMLFFIMFAVTKDTVTETVSFKLLPTHHVSR